MKNFIINNKTKSDLTGQRFGRLTVISFSQYVDNGRRTSWLCQCDCGNTLEVPRRYLATGHKKSCGCLERDNFFQKTHGKSKSKIYMAWGSMIERCYNPNNQAWKNYGGRGIQVCERWKKYFGEFYKDVGDRPKGLTLDRKDNNKSYSCGKCEECLKNNWETNWRWTTRKIQCRNKRNSIIIEYNGIKKQINEWAELLGIKRDTLYVRIKYYGYSIEEAFNKK